MSFITIFSKRRKRNVIPSGGGGTPPVSYPDIVYLGAKTAVSASVANYSVDYPTGTVPGDVFILSGVSNGTIVGITGTFSLFDSRTQSSCVGFVYTRIADGTESSSSNIRIFNSPNARGSATLTAWRNVDTADIIGVYVEGGGYTASSVYVTGTCDKDNSVALAAASASGDITTSITGTAFVEISNLFSAFNGSCLSYMQNVNNGTFLGGYGINFAGTQSFNTQLFFLNKKTS